MSDSFDYLVIGAGTAGCALAARLSEDPRVQVALLEAGADRRDTRQPDWGFHTVAQPGLNGRAIAQPRGRVVGGTSAIGAMVSTRGHPADYDAWAAEGNTGWGHAELLPCLRRAEQHCRGADAAGPNPYAAGFIEVARQLGLAANDDFNGKATEGVGPWPWLQHTDQAGSAADAYLRPALARPNFTLVTGAHAMRVLLEGRRAVGVEYGHQGYQKQLRADREVLLCAGALQSPQLLMLSGIGPHQQLVDNGIATRHHLPGVGQQLFDQPEMAQWLMPPGGAWRRLLGLRPWRSAPSALPVAVAGGFVRSQPEAPRPDLQLSFATGHHGDPARSCTLQVRVLHPQSRGSVKLDGKDPFAPPQIDTNLLGDRDDMARLLRGFRLLRQIAAQPSLAVLGGREATASARAQGELQLEQFVRDHAGTGHNPAGSCRMGGGAMDVVDARLRVHGIAGLRVVDASILPAPVGAGLVVPVLAIAEKAAELVRADAA